MLGVKRWASQYQGMSDVITAINFDNAVMTFGVWCENKLSERREDGSPIYKLDTLLDIKKSVSEKARANMQQFAALQALMKGG